MQCNAHVFLPYHIINLDLWPQLMSRTISHLLTDSVSLKWNSSRVALDPISGHTEEEGKGEGEGEKVPATRVHNECAAGGFRQDICTRVCQHARSCADTAHVRVP